jgi:hypothetical protein
MQSTHISVYINTHNLIDHRRDSTIALIRFETLREFRRYTRRGRIFP